MWCLSPNPGARPGDVGVGRGPPRSEVEDGEGDVVVGVLVGGDAGDVVGGVVVNEVDEGEVVELLQETVRGEDELRARLDLVPGEDDDVGDGDDELGIGVLEGEAADGPGDGDAAGVDALGVFFSGAKGRRGGELADEFAGRRGPGLGGGSADAAPGVFDAPGFGGIRREVRPGQGGDVFVVDDEGDRIARPADDDVVGVDDGDDGRRDVGPLAFLRRRRQRLGLGAREVVFHDVHIRATIGVEQMRKSRRRRLRRPRTAGAVEDAAAEERRVAVEQHRHVLHGLPTADVRACGAPRRRARRHDGHLAR
mmetsp:Transcript_8144/g.21115  ORF Transcript_8144/g.21115 Transcript_8144/m.21115 type:complete len:309 (-) Transcript_8144:1262-2188(-)